MQTYRSTFHVYFQQTLLDALAVQQIIVLNYLRYIAKSHPCENCCFSETKLENSFTFEQSSSIKVHFPPMRTAQVKWLLYDRTIPFNWYSVSPTFILSYKCIPFISSGENSMKWNFECAAEVRNCSNVGFSQSGKLNFPGWVWMVETYSGQEMPFKPDFCNADLVTTFNWIELFRVTSFLHVWQNDWNVLPDEKRFISSRVSLPNNKVFCSKISLKQALQSLSKKDGQCCLK